MIHTVGIYEDKEEKIISYCSENDFEHSLRIGQRCRVVTESHDFVGIVSCINEESFILQDNSRNNVAVILSDIVDIFCEEEIGAIN